MYRSTAFALSTLALLAACSDDITDIPTVTAPPVAPPTTVFISPDAVLEWNDVAAQFVALSNAPAPMAPTNESVIYAMVHGAVHDVVNALVPRYRPYAYVVPLATVLEGQLSTTYDAAVAMAAFTILEDAGAKIAASAMAPNGEPLVFARQRFAEALDRISDGPAKEQGLQLGREAALAMLMLRADDGVAGQGLEPFTTAGTPGAYRATPPFASAPDNMTGMAAGQHWARVKPFVLTSANQFRPLAPYGTETLSDAVQTARYTADFNEVKRMGGVSSERTTEQTDIAFFWMENSPLAWNRVARALAISHKLDGNDVAHLLAVLNFAEADAYISAFDAKYTFGFWRPITAIRLAETDGNTDTEADSTWDVASATIGIPTPPSPDYSSGHATAGGAAAAVLEALIPNSTGFSMTSSTLPNQTRSFESVGQAAAENAESRVWIGYHFRLATEIGLEQGRAVGSLVAGYALRPLN